MLKSIIDDFELQFKYVEMLIVELWVLHYCKIALEMMLFR